jgi:hypothetical protein
VHVHGTYEDEPCLTQRCTKRRNQITPPCCHQSQSSTTYILSYTTPTTMSLNLLGSSLRSGQPSLARGLLTSALRATAQPLKPAHPADVVSGHSSIAPTEPESPRELAAEVISDAPSKSILIKHMLRTRTGRTGAILSDRDELMLTSHRGTPAPPSTNLPPYQIHHAVRQGQDEKVDLGLGYPTRSWTMGESIDGLG